jgi:aldose 1-epimerase
MIPKKVFGEIDGRRVEVATLESSQAQVSILSYGCATQDWVIARKQGELRVLQGFASMAEYGSKSASHGIIAGRVANRIANASFELDGEMHRISTKAGPHTLHGGINGLGKRIWNLDTDSAAQQLRLAYHSPHGEEGYPGAVDFSVTITLNAARLEWVMQAMPDRRTPINLAQHNYYNLNGSGTCLDHTLHVDADSYTPTDTDLIPDGSVQPVQATRYDFRKPVPMRAIDPEGLGVDMNLVLRPGRDLAMPCAMAVGDKTGVELRVWSDQPGLQVYNSVMAKDGVTGLSGVTYGRFSGLCLEAQHFPDAVHHSQFPSIIRSPEQPYNQNYAVQIAG